MVSGSVIFSGIQFLVSLIVVNRIREASRRFYYTHETYGRFSFALLRLACFFTSEVDNSPNWATKFEDLKIFRIRFLRWIRAVHVLAMEECAGFETPKYRMGTLSYQEEVILFHDARKAMRVIRWLFRGYSRNKFLFSPGNPTDVKMQNMIDEVLLTYGNLMVVAHQIYPFPLAQGALISVIAYGFWSPLAFAIMLPHSYFLAPFICFTSVWLTYGVNLAAQYLEWPFDGDVNDLPFAYFSMRFIREMGEIEFGIDSPLVPINVDNLIPHQFQSEMKDEIVIPQQRPPLGGRGNTREWLDRAREDLQQVRMSRKKLRSRLLPVVSEKEGYAQWQEHSGQNMSQIRALGGFKNVQ